MILKGSTPEQLRDEVVKWLREQASQYRRTASYAKRKRLAVIATEKSKSFEFAANQIEMARLGK